MIFNDFISTPHTLAMVITIEEYMSIKPLLQEIYSVKDIEHIDDYCSYKPWSERFLLCNPAEKSMISTPMMYLNAVTFVDRVPFKDIDFSELEPKSKDFQTEDLIKEVETLHNNTPDGVIHDADTILVDLIDNSDFEVSGIAQEIFDIWKNSTDKKAVEQMFYAFTDMEFDKYLLKCKAEITREPEIGVRSQLSDQILSASARTAASQPTSQAKAKEPEPEI